MMRALLFLSAVIAVCGQTITPSRARVEVIVEKTGLMSGKKHTLRWEKFEGTFTVSPPRVEFVVEAASVKVLDDWINDSKKENVRKETVGKNVLDAARFPQIRFVSTSVTGDLSSTFHVAGILTIRDVTKPVTLTVKRIASGYEAEARFPMSAFGIKPPKAALGAVGTKDEMTMRFASESSK